MTLEELITSEEYSGLDGERRNMVLDSWTEWSANKAVEDAERIVQDPYRAPSEKQAVVEGIEKTHSGLMYRNSLQREVNSLRLTQKQADGLYDGYIDNGYQAELDAEDKSALGSFYGEFKKTFMNMSVGHVYHSLFRDDPQSANEFQWRMEQENPRDETDPIANLYGEVAGSLLPTGVALVTALVPGLQPVAPAAAATMLGYYGLVGAGAARNKADARRLLNGEEISGQEEFDMAIGYASAEIMFERMGFGFLKDVGTVTAKTLGKAVRTKNKAALNKVFLKTWAEATGANALQEGATELSQNVIDSFFTSDDKPLTENVGRAMAVGAVAGKSLGAFSAGRARIEAGRQFEVATMTDPEGITAVEKLKTELRANVAGKPGEAEANAAIDNISWYNPFQDLTALAEETDQNLGQEPGVARQRAEQFARLDGILKKVGVKPIMVKGLSVEELRIRGVNLPTDPKYVYVDYARNENARDAASWVGAHEVYHALDTFYKLKPEGPDLFTQLTDLITTDDKFESYRERLEQEGYDTQEAREEFAADFFADQFTSNEFWDALLEKDEQLFNDVKSTLSAWLGVLKRTPDPANKELLTDLEQAEKIAQDIFLTAAQRTDAGDVIAPPSAESPSVGTADPEEEGAADPVVEPDASEVLSSYKITDPTPQEIGSVQQAIDSGGDVAQVIQQIATERSIARGNEIIDSSDRDVPIDEITPEVQDFVNRWKEALASEEGDSAFTSDPVNEEFFRNNQDAIEAAVQDQSGIEPKGVATPSASLNKLRRQGYDVSASDDGNALHVRDTSNNPNTHGNRLDVTRQGKAGVVVKAHVPSLEKAASHKSGQDTFREDYIVPTKVTAKNIDRQMAFLEDAAALADELGVDVVLEDDNMRRDAFIQNKLKSLGFDKASDTKWVRHYNPRDNSKVGSEGLTPADMDIEVGPDDQLGLSLFDESTYADENDAADDVEAEQNGTSPDSSTGLDSLNIKLLDMADSVLPPEKAGLPYDDQYADGTTYSAFARDVRRKIISKEFDEARALVVAQEAKSVSPAEGKFWELKQADKELLNTLLPHVAAVIDKAQSLANAKMSRIAQPTTAMAGAQIEANAKFSRVLGQEAEPISRERYPHHMVGKDVQGTTFPSFEDYVSLEEWWSELNTPQKIWKNHLAYGPFLDERAWKIALARAHVRGLDELVGYDFNTVEELQPQDTSDQGAKFSRTGEFKADRQTLTVTDSAGRTWGHIKPINVNGKEKYVPVFRVGEGYAKRLTQGQYRTAWPTIDSASDALLEAVESQASRNPGLIKYSRTKPHPATVSTRVPSAKTSTEDSLNHDLVINTEVMKKDQKRYNAMLNKMAMYPGVPKSVRKMRDQEAKERAIKDHMKSNLMFLYNLLPKHAREQAKLWYDGTHRIAKDFGKLYGVPIEVSAGVIAVLSPETPWFLNLAQAQKILDVHKNRPEWNEDMTHVFMTDMQHRGWHADSPAVKDAFAPYIGKGYGDIPAENLLAKSVWIRIYAQTTAKAGYHVAYPNGTWGGIVRNKIKPGQILADPSAFWFGYGANLIKALEILNHQNPEAISLRLGNDHKVRNFYNNVLDPNAIRGDVTIDIHASNGSVLIPGDPSVFGDIFGNPSQNEVLGVKGNYGFIADVFRELADELGMLPREFQSITWEAGRLLLDDQFNQHERLYELWEEYADGNVTIGDTHAEIQKLALPNGLKLPQHLRRLGNKQAEGAGYASNTSELFGANRGQGPATSGSRQSPPATSAAQARGRVKPLKLNSGNINDLTSATTPNAAKFSKDPLDDYVHDRELVNNLISATDEDVYMFEEYISSTPSEFLATAEERGHMNNPQFVEEYLTPAFYAALSAEEKGLAPLVYADLTTGEPLKTPLTQREAQRRVDANMSRVTPAQDERYLELATQPKPDKVGLKRMVDKAKKATGYIIDGWHGTKAGGFTIFDTTSERAKEGATPPSVNDPTAFIGSHFAIGAKGPRIARKFMDGMFRGSLLAEEGDKQLYKVAIKLDNPIILTQEQLEVIVLSHAVVANQKFHQDFFDENAEEYGLSRDADPFEMLPQDMGFNLGSMTAEENSNLDTLADMYREYTIKSFEFEEDSGIFWAMEAGALVREMLEQRGHDGIIHENTVDDGTSAVVFDPSNIKMSDTITRDDNGSIIPLSERFDPTKPDARFSRVSDDEYVAWHGSSNPAPIERFDPDRAGNSTWGAGFYFSTDDAVSQVFARRGSARQYRIKMKNPLRLDPKKPETMQPLHDMGLEGKSAVQLYNVPRVINDPQAWAKQKYREYMETIEAAGYDGIILTVHGGTLHEHHHYIVPATEEGADRVSMEPLPKFSRTDEQYFDHLKNGDRFQAEQIVIESAKNAGHLVANAFHGTTHDFNEFDENKANRDSHYGPAFYFSSDAVDSTSNYSHGFGGDITVRINNLAEELNEDADRLEELAESLGIPTEGNDNIDLSISVAKKLLVGDQERVVSAYLRIENPAILGAERRTASGVSKQSFFEGIEYYDEEAIADYMDTAWVTVKEDLSLEESDKADYADEIREEAERWADENGYLNDSEPPLLEIIRQVERKYEGAESALDSVYNELLSGTTYAAIEDILMNQWGGDAITDAAGELVPPGRLMADVYRALGHDGIIDNRVRNKFGGRLIGDGIYTPGMPDVGDTHYVVFDANQIKLADIETFDDDGNTIPPSKRFDKTTNDIRFSRIADTKQESLHNAPQMARSRIAHIDTGYMEALENSDTNAMAGFIQQASKFDGRNHPLVARSPEGRILLPSERFGLRDVGARFSRAGRTRQGEAAQRSYDNFAAQVRGAAQGRQARRDYGAALARAQGFKPRRNIANVGETAGVRGLIDTVDVYMESMGLPSQESMEQARERAHAEYDRLGSAEVIRRLIRGTDPSATGERIDLESMAGTFMARKAINEEGVQALSDWITSGDDASIANFGMLVEHYRNARSKIARALAAGKDLLETPAQRNRRFIVMAISEPSPEARRDIQKAMERGQRDRALELMRKDLLKRQELMATLNQLGYDFDSIFTDEVLNDPTAVAQIVREIMIMNAGFSDMAYEWYRNAILSAPPTQVANAFGFVIGAFWEYFAQRPAEATLKSLASVVGKDINGTTFGELIYAYQGLWRGASIGWQNAIQAWNTEAPIFDGSSKIDMKGISIPTKWGGRVIRSPQRALVAGDEMGKSVIFQMEVRAQAYRSYRRLSDEERQGVTLDQYMETTSNNPASQEFQEADEMARWIAFQSAPGEIARAAMRMRESETNAFGRWMARLMFPFVVTPANIVKIGLRKTPLGLIAALHGTNQAGERARQAGFNEREAKEAEGLRRASEQLLAWGMIATLIEYALGEDEDGDPIITGSGKFGGERSAQFRARPPQSIKIGGKWLSYARIEPFATTITMMVDSITALSMSEKIGGHDPVEKTMAKLGAASMTAFMDKTFLRQVGDLVRAVSGFARDDSTQFVNWAYNFPAAMMPNFFKQAARAYQQSFAERRPLGYGERMGEALLPGSKAEVKIDVWGDPVSAVNIHMSPASDFIYRLVSPFKLTTVEKPTLQLDRMIFNYNASRPEGSPKWYPSAPSYKFSQKNMTYKMSPREYRQFLEIRGQYAQRVLLNSNLNYDNPTILDIKKTQRALAKGGRLAKSDWFRNKGIVPGQPQDVVESVELGAF